MLCNIVDCSASFQFPQCKVWQQRLVQPITCVSGKPSTFLWRGCDIELIVTAKAIYTRVIASRTW